MERNRGQARRRSPDRVPGRGSSIQRMVERSRRQQGSFGGERDKRRNVEMIKTNRFSRPKPAAGGYHSDRSSTQPTTAHRRRRFSSPQSKATKSAESVRRRSESRRVSARSESCKGASRASSLASHGKRPAWDDDAQEYEPRGLSVCVRGLRGSTNAAIVEREFLESFGLGQVSVHRISDDSAEVTMESGADLAKVREALRSSQLEIDGVDVSVVFDMDCEAGNRPAEPAASAPENEHRTEANYMDRFAEAHRKLCDLFHDADSLQLGGCTVHDELMGTRIVYRVGRPIPTSIRRLIAAAIEEEIVPIPGQRFWVDIDCPANEG